MTYGIISLDWPTDGFMFLAPILNSKDWWFEEEDLLYYYHTGKNEANTEMEISHEHHYRKNLNNWTVCYPFS